MIINFNIEPSAIKQLESIEVDHIRVFFNDYGRLSVTEGEWEEIQSAIAMLSVNVRGKLEQVLNRFKGINRVSIMPGRITGNPLARGSADVENLPTEFDLIVIPPEVPPARHGFTHGPGCDQSNCHLLEQPCIERTEARNVLVSAKYLYCKDNAHKRISIAKESRDAVWNLYFRRIFENAGEIELVDRYALSKMQLPGLKYFLEKVSESTKNCRVKLFASEECFRQQGSRVIDKEFKDRQIESIREDLNFRLHGISDVELYLVSAGLAEREIHARYFKCANDALEIDRGMGALVGRDDSGEYWHTLHRVNWELVARDGDPIEAIQGEFLRARQASARGRLPGEIILLKREEPDHAY